ncbi:MAG: tripartite tricarboxylate transporter TctB family protein [Spirochaetia bacterium]|nr:tripartite tricarboxylate transporter TctB family protein [Spirochaetia bacterium]
MNQSKYEWLLLACMMLIVGVVFWQVHTDMTEAGIASGGPLNNAAAYPRGLAVILALLSATRIVIKIFKRTEDEAAEGNGGKAVLDAFYRSSLLLILFAIYLWGLGYFGYHIMTPIFLIVVLYYAGERKWQMMLLFGVLSSLAVAFIFEVFLKIVLPGGIFSINIPW